MKQISKFYAIRDLIGGIQKLAGVKTTFITGYTSNIWLPADGTSEKVRLMIRSSSSVSKLRLFLEDSSEMSKI